eukprot:1453548-Pyramimonas_sp.AAC.1
MEEESFFPAVGDAPDDAMDDEPPQEPGDDVSMQDFGLDSATATGTQSVGATIRSKDHAFLAIPPRLLEVREHLRAAGLGSGTPNYEQTYLVYGAPEPPAYLPSMGTVGNEVLHWGDAQGTWGPTSYTDGSGYDSNMPEIRRCGQA